MSRAVPAVAALPPSAVSLPEKPKPSVGMSTPDALRKLIEELHGTFYPDLERQEFTDRKDLYRLYLDLLELDYLKLQKLVDKHSKDEPPDKYCLRQKLAAVFNLVPAVLNIVKLYLFSEDPGLDVKKDKDLDAFVNNADGNGTPYIKWVRNRVLPMSMLFGYVDALIQNPLVTRNPMNEADAQAEGILPRAHVVTPLKRINWSCQTNDAYNWVCFLDRGSEDAHPLRRNVKPVQAYITLSAANQAIFAQEGQTPPPESEHAFWIRSWRPLDTTGSGTPPIPAQPLPPGAAQQAQWAHEADWCPTARVPMATLVYQDSNDDDSRHDGVSKVATIAVLTRLIIQILSWSTEDVLASLALLAMPSAGGRKPKSEDGEPMTLDAFTTLWYHHEAKEGPHFVQGDTSHIEIKLKLVQMCLTEILRQAHLIGASGEAEKVTSGVQGIVMRSELHQELKDTAERLDAFTLDVFALVKSWATGDDWDRQKVIDDIGPTVSWFKGPYTVDAVEQVVRDATAVMALFRDVSPTLVEASFKQVARAALSSDDQDLPEVLKEIDVNTGKVLQDARELEELATAAAISGGREAGTVNIRETDTGGESAAGKTETTKPAAGGKGGGN